MLRSFWRSRHQHWTSCAAHRFSTRSLSTAKGREYRPLRVLFCGADEFSAFSLRALNTLRVNSPNSVESIDVVCRPDKRVGRGLKQVRAVPIKGVANELELRVHQIDSFKDWEPPESINLVVAVSFGLLVPARILEAAEYGGLNVHPSMLPDLRGPAPIQHTLLKRRKYTGVTLQTMHPIRFDHGAILAQTSWPGIPVANAHSPHQVQEILGPLGAELLCHGIQRGVFVPPIQDLAAALPKREIEYAPKITGEDRHIDWNTWDSDEVTIRDNALGRLWDMSTYSRCADTADGAVVKRVTFDGPWSRVHGESLSPCNVHHAASGSVHVYADGNDTRLAITAADGVFVSPNNATIEGERKHAGIVRLTRMLIEAKQKSAR